MVDLFSHFPVIRKLSGENMKTVLKAIQNVFADFGIPETNDFCARFEIKHLMVKNQNDTWLSLLILKATPMTGIDRSPAELLCNRHFRTNIPMIQHASNLPSQAKLCNEDPTKY